MTSSPIPNFTWESTTRWWYEDALNLLPPVRIRGGYVLAGEAMDHEGPGGRARYRVAWEAGSYWKGSRPVTIAEFDALTARGV